MKDYRLTLKVRNNRILKAIDDVGGAPGKMWCDANGLRYSSVNDLINMTVSPLYKSGELSKDANALCGVLGKLPEDLWSNEQIYPLEKNFSEMEMDYEQVVALLPENDRYYLLDDSVIYEKQQSEIISVVLESLRPQEKKVVDMVYMEGMTLTATAKELGVSVSRVSQILKRALRMLRRTECASQLYPLFNHPR